MTKRYYIAYGSNLNIDQMSYRCPRAKVVGTSEIPDFQLLFKGSKSGAYLTIEPKKGEKVPVAVWEVTADDELSLDRYEGYPNFYYKTEVEIPVIGISDRKVRKLKAFIYIMHEERPMDMLNFAVASSVIKHTIHGDANIIDDVQTIRNLMNMNYDIRR